MPEIISAENRSQSNSGSGRYSSRIWTGTVPATVKRASYGGSTMVPISLSGNSFPLFGTVVFGNLTMRQSASGEISDIIQAEFAKLSQKWRSERNPLSSSVTEICSHPAYRAIIGLGWVVVPNILRELESEIDHWFWALEAITGEKPVSAHSAGDLDQMAQAWINWGRSRRLV